MKELSKELSIEEKARRYDEAFRIAQELYNNPHSSDIGKEWICSVFPELKENTCLEKQCEKKYSDKVEPKFHVGDTMRTLQEAADGYTDGMPVVVSIDKEYYHCTNELIAIKDQDNYEFPPINMKQKPANKVEPKFHVGDWIIQENIGVYKVIEICESWYEVVDNKDKHYSIGFDKEYMCRPWTIEDAKNGDALVASDGSIFLFAGVDDCACKYYAALTTDNNIEINKDVERKYWETSRAVYPATKEQRYILFQKIKEAGYNQSSRFK